MPANSPLRHFVSEFPAADPAASNSHADPVRQAFGVRPSDLAAVHRRDVNLLIWRRPPIDGIAAFAGTLANLTGFSVCTEGTPLDITRHLRRSLVRHSTGHRPARERFVADVSRLTWLFSNLSRSASVHLHLEAVGDDACHIFHVDRRTLRLLVTYHGRGTEWLPEAAIDRDALGYGRNDEICLDRGAVGRLKPFWAGVFKGSAAPGNERSGIVHRSPPIGRSGRSRLLLRLDPSADIVNLHD